MRKSTAQTTPELIFTGLEAAAGATGIPYVLLKAVKAQGAPGFERSGRVHLKPALEWYFAQGEAALETPPDGMKHWGEAVKMWDAKKRELAFRQASGELVSRSWVCEAISKMHGKVEAFRHKSESEHAPLFAAANGDIAKSRSILRGIWDAIKKDLHSLGEHLAEGKDA